MKLPTFGKTKMQKFETALAALRKRASLLADKRRSAQAALDAAIGARQAMLLDGDLDDQKLAAKLQSAVDSAQSALIGLDDAISASQVQIDSAEHDLAAERQRVERQAASEALAASVASIQAKFEPWLTTTRAFAESLESIAHVRFEPGQIAAYVGVCASEVEIAAAVMLDDLHRLVPAIAGGQEPIPRDPETVTPAPAAVVPQSVKIFTIQPVKFVDRATNGLKTWPAFYELDLPADLAAKALALKAAVPIDHETAKRSLAKGGGMGFEWPNADRCVSLDAEEKGSNQSPYEPILHSAFEQQPPGFQQVDRGKPFIVKTAAGNPVGEAA
jgi:hypothetical protein